LIYNYWCFLQWIIASMLSFIFSVFGACHYCFCWNQPQIMKSLPFPLNKVLGHYCAYAHWCLKALMINLCYIFIFVFRLLKKNSKLIYNYWCFLQWIITSMLSFVCSVFGACHYCFCWNQPQIMKSSFLPLKKVLGHNCANAY